MNASAPALQNRLGPVLLEILHSAVTAVAEEMSIAVRRTSRSTTVREMLDAVEQTMFGSASDLARVVRPW